MSQQVHFSLTNAATQDPTTQHTTASFDDQHTEKNFQLSKYCLFFKIFLLKFVICAKVDQGRSILSLQVGNSGSGSTDFSSKVRTLVVLAAFFILFFLFSAAVASICCCVVRLSSLPMLPLAVLSALKILNLSLIVVIATLSSNSKNSFFFCSMGRWQINI